MTIANIVSNDTDRQFLGYTWEAQRLNPQVPFIPRVARKNVTVQNGDQNLTINVGDRIAVAIKIANMDSSKWGPHPEKIDPNRDPHLYRVFGSGRCRSDSPDSPSTRRWAQGWSTNATQLNNRSPSQQACTHVSVTRSSTWPSRSCLER